MINIDEYNVVGCVWTGFDLHQLKSIKIGFNSISDQSQFKLTGQKIRSNSIRFSFIRQTRSYTVSDWSWLNSIWFDQSWPVFKMFHQIWSSSIWRDMIQSWTILLKSDWIRCDWKPFDLIGIGYYPLEGWSLETGAEITFAGCPDWLRGLLDPADSSGNECRRNRSAGVGRFRRVHR